MQTIFVLFAMVGLILACNTSTLSFEESVKYLNPYIANQDRSDQNPRISEVAAIQLITATTTMTDATGDSTGVLLLPEKSASGCISDMIRYTNLTIPQKIKYLHDKSNINGSTDRRNRSSKDRARCSIGES